MREVCLRPPVPLSWCSNARFPRLVLRRRGKAESFSFVPLPSGSLPNVRLKRPRNLPGCLAEPLLAPTVRFSWCSNVPFRRPVLRCREKAVPRVRVAHLLLPDDAVRNLRVKHRPNLLGCFLEPFLPLAAQRSWCLNAREDPGDRFWESPKIGAFPDPKFDRFGRGRSPSHSPRVGRASPRGVCAQPTSSAFEESSFVKKSASANR